MATESITPVLDRTYIESSVHSSEASEDLPSPLARGNSMNLVDVHHLRKSYGDHLAVKDVSFSLEAGEILGLLGPNGAGKSTTMMMVAGLLKPSAGDVWLNGRKFDGRDLQQRKLLGVVPQEYAIYHELNAIDNLLFFGKLYGLGPKERKARSDEVLQQIGLVEAAHRPSGTYSGGMKRRLNFGVALMHRPEVLILDEPTVGIDPQSRSHLMDCVRQQAANGTGIIYASHYMEEVQSICQRVVIIDSGQVLANDSIPNLLAGVAADVYLYIDRTAGISDEFHGLGRLGTGSDGEPAVIVSGEAPVARNNSDRGPLRYGAGTLSAENRAAPSNLAWRLQTALHKLATLGIHVLRVETQQSNLERLFLQLTGKRLRD
jgi:ABC-2 type transport system ATP-binding protein